MDGVDYSTRAERERKLGGDISQLVKSAMNNYGLTSIELANMLYREMGMDRQLSAQGYIGHIRNGYYHHFLATEKSVRSKLALVLDALGIEGDHPVIRQLKELYPSLVYPPPRKKGATLEEPTRDLALEQQVGYLRPEHKKIVGRLVARIISGYDNTI